MKTFFKHLIMAWVMAMPLFSCNDFLNEDPKGQLMQSNFFGSERDLDLAVTALYEYIWERQARLEGQIHMWGGDDMTTHPASNKEDFRGFDRYNPSEINARLQSGAPITSSTMPAAFRVTMPASTRG